MLEFTEVLEIINRRLGEHKRYSPEWEVLMLVKAELEKANERVLDMYADYEMSKYRNIEDSRRDK